MLQIFFSVTYFQILCFPTVDHLPKSSTNLCFCTEMGRKTGEKKKLNLIFLQRNHTKESNGTAKNTSKYKAH